MKIKTLTNGTTIYQPFPFPETLEGTETVAHCPAAKPYWKNRLHPVGNQTRVTVV